MKWEGEATMCEGYDATPRSYHQEPEVPKRLRPEPYHLERL